MAKAKCDIRIGTSGWHYGHWAGPFYPADLPKDKWFAYYAKNFDTVEINNTFYHLPREETFRNWCKQAPAGFLFAVKANRYITHIKRLKDPQEVLDRFFERVRLLKGSLGPILYQLPPSLHKDLAPLERRPSILRSSTKDESFLTGLDRLEGFLQVLSSVILNPSPSGCVAIGFTEGLSCWLSHQNYKVLFDGQQQIFFTPILAKTQAFSSCH